MKAIEFFTTAKDGKSIEIPKKYTKQISGEIRVIILLNNKTASKTPKPSTKKAFNALKLKTKGFKFNREDIYNDE